MGGSYESKSILARLGRAGAVSGCRGGIGVVQNVPSDGSERAVANGVMMVNLQPKVQSSTFSSGQNVTTSAAANVRLGPGTNYGIRTTVTAGSTGTVQSHALNGVSAKGYYWWKVNFSGTVGWIAESLLIGPTSPPVITQQPTPQNVVSGGTTSDSAALGVYTNILLNGGFESWAGSVTADNWTQYNKTGTVGCSKGTTFSGTPSVSAHGGSQWQRVKLDSNNEEGGAYQRFSSTSRVQYTVSAWLLTRITSSGETVEAKLGVDPTGATTPGANTTWSTTVTGDSSWTQKTLTITATGSYITVFLDGRHSSSSTSQVNIFFDDASAQ